MANVAIKFEKKLGPDGDEVRKTGLVVYVLCHFPWDCLQGAL